MQFNEDRRISDILDMQVVKAAGAMTQTVLEAEEAKIELQEKLKMERSNARQLEEEVDRFRRKAKALWDIWFAFSHCKQRSYKGLVQRSRRKR